MHPELKEAFGKNKVGEESLRDRCQLKCFLPHLVKFGVWRSLQTDVESCCLTLTKLLVSLSNEQPPFDK